MSEQDQDYGFETLAIHAGAAPDPTTGARATPIYQTTSFVFDDVDHAASLFNLQRFGNIYSRITNPTVSVLEERIAALEGGTAACAVASGHAAQFVTFLNLMEPGDEIISSTKLYGGSITQFGETFPKFDWHVRFVDPTEPKQFKKALRKRTKAIFVESASNPDGVICDLEAIAAIAHGAGVPLVVDNTMPTPYLCQPVRHGADIVVHSMTKYIGGHGNSMGGVIVDGGSFDWFQSDRFPALTAPTKAYHGIRFAETFGDFGFAMRCKAVGLRDTGPCLSPFNAFLLLMGVRDPAAAHATARRECPGGGRVPGRPPAGRVGLVPGPAEQPPSRAGQALHAAGHRRGVHVRGQGWLSDGHQGGRGLRAALAPRQHRRHALADHPSGLDDPPAAGRGAAAQSRRRARGDPPVDRPRDRRRHHRGSRPGAHCRGPGHHRERGVGWTTGLLDLVAAWPLW